MRDNRRVPITVQRPKKKPLLLMRRGLLEYCAFSLLIFHPNVREQGAGVGTFSRRLLRRDRCRGFVGPVPQPLLMRSEVLFN